MGEEVELTEVGDDTLKSYKTKALFDVRAANARLSAFEPELKSKNVAKDTHQLVKRSIGVIRANKQLKREPKEVVTESNTDDERDERRDAREPASTSKAKAPYKLEPAMISGRKFVQQGAKVPRGYEMTAHGRIVKKAPKSKERALGEEAELNEGDLRLVSIYKNKKGEAHTLWQTGQYEYHMTPSKQSVSGHFPKTKTWNKSLEDVHKELGENGFKIHHTPLSA